MPSGIQILTPANETLLASRILSGSAASIDFSGIPAGFNHLRLLVLAATDKAAVDNALIALRFNNDSGANYARQYGLANAAVTINNAVNAANQGSIGITPAATATANRAGIADVLIPGYALTTFQKQYRSDTGTTPNATAGWTGDMSGVWFSTAAINRITIVEETGANLIAGSAAWLYGIT